MNEARNPERIQKMMNDMDLKPNNSPKKMKDLDYGWKGFMKKKQQQSLFADINISSTKSGINRQRDTNKNLSI